MEKNRHTLLLNSQLRKKCSQSETIKVKPCPDEQKKSRYINVFFVYILPCATTLFKSMVDGDLKTENCPHRKVLSKILLFYPSRGIPCVRSRRSKEE